MGYLMKKTLTLLFVISLSIFLISCEKADDLNSDEYGFSAEKYVHLPDYGDLKIQPSDYAVTDEDIDRYIYFELMSNNLYDNETLNNALKDGKIKQYLTRQISEKYFSKKSSSELIKTIRYKIQRDRIWNKFYEYIIEYAYADYFPKQKDEYLKFKMDYISSIAEAENISPKEYIENEYNISLSEYRESQTYAFLEIMVIKAIADQEGVQCESNDYEDKITEISLDEGTDEESIKKYYSKYDIYNEIYIDLLKEYMLKKYD